MNIEYEATFTAVDKDEVRSRLKKAGATLVKPEFLQKRLNFTLPTGHEIKGGWLRVRDEDDKITMSLKVIDGDKMEDQKELCLHIDDFNDGVALLKALGCEEKAYQESRREIWNLDQVEVTIDEWPYLEPYVEIEGKSEEEVKKASAKLGFDYGQAVFGAVDIQYKKKYGLTCEMINMTKRVTFEDPNPFIK
jgi:adenylate cyclase class 2